MAKKPPDSDDVLTIAQLVQAQIDNGVSLRQLEANSGGVVKYQHFDKLRRGEVTQWPRSAEAIEATAQALEVDVRQVVLSYAAQFGIDVREHRSALAAMLPAGTHRLTLPQARAIAALVRLFVEAADGAAAAGSTGRRGPVRSHDGGPEDVPASGLPRAASVRKSTQRDQK